MTTTTPTDRSPTVLDAVTAGAAGERVRVGSGGAGEHVHVRPGRAGATLDWPAWLPAEAVTAFARVGVPRPWEHQVEAAEAIWSGRDTVLATPTASGKSLAYLMPLLGTVLGPPGVGRRPPPPGPRSAAVGVVRGVLAPTALYLAPTKALAHDQLRACRALGVAGWRVQTLDGDSGDDERAFARAHAHLVLTNPDMLHRSVLPSHQRWSRLLRSLSHVVVDESHRYRGVFGSHVSAVLRRLRRLAAHHGSDPVLVLASATSADPRESASRLVGVEPERLSVVTDDTSLRGRLTLTLRHPAEGVDEAAVQTLVGHVEAGRQALAFLPSRLRTELVADAAQRRLERSAQAAAGAGIPTGTRAPRKAGTADAEGRPLVEAYRSGYLPGERRSIEARLQDGSVRAVAATNALELGIDVAGLDAVVIGGHPGTMTAFWQQAGRAGRRGGPAEVLLLTREDPLDQHLLEHPELVTSGQVEAAVLHPGNPYVLGPHLAAAAQELPLQPGDARWFGPGTVELAERLAGQGVLRARDGSWFWVRPDRAVDAIDLRSAGGSPVEILEQGTGRVVGQADAAGADRTVHTGAVYLHRGQTWRVVEYRCEDSEAWVVPDSPAYRTQAQSGHEVRIVAEQARRRLPRAALQLGRVEVATQVTGYLRRDARSGAVWDHTPLDLPRRVLSTQSLWFVPDAGLLTELGLAPMVLAGAVHAAEHCGIGLLPALTPCDRWDVGGLSTVLHPDTGACTVFVHDAHPGGSGYAEHAYHHAEAWLTATWERLRRCRCADGCPACVVSPKCGNANQVLDKHAATRLLAGVLGH